MNEIEPVKSSCLRVIPIACVCLATYEMQEYHTGKNLYAHPSRDHTIFISEALKPVVMNPARHKDVVCFHAFQRFHLVLGVE